MGLVKFQFRNNKKKEMEAVLVFFLQSLTVRCGSGGHVGGQQHLRGPDVAAAGPVGPGQRGAEPGGLREERAAVLPLAAPHREGRGAAGVVRQRPHRPAAAQLQPSAGQEQRWVEEIFRKKPSLDHLW